MEYEIKSAFENITLLFWAKVKNKACLPQLLSPFVSLVRFRVIRSHLGVIKKSVVFQVRKRERLADPDDDMSHKKLDKFFPNPPDCHKNIRLLKTLTENFHAGFNNLNLENKRACFLVQRERTEFLDTRSRYLLATYGFFGFFLPWLRQK